jgi:methylmalonyl-CoA mutase
MRCTTEAMSAIFGGCDYLIVEAARFAQHLAESLPRVLGEESHFDQVSDPGGGSFYIEALTASIAAEAWKVYEDGLAGRDAAIAAARAAKEKAVAQRWWVKAFQVSGETGLVGDPIPSR